MTLSERIQAPWLYEEDTVGEDGSYVPPRLWGTKPDGNLTLIAEFAVPVNKYIVSFLISAVSDICVTDKPHE